MRGVARPGSLRPYSDLEAAVSTCPALVACPPDEGAADSEKQNTQPAEDEISG